MVLQTLCWLLGELSLPIGLLVCKKVLYNSICSSVFNFNKVVTGVNIETYTLQRDIINIQ